MFSFFKKSKVENTADFDEMSVILPKSKVEKTLAQIINEHDEEEMKKHDAYQMANIDHHVKINGKMMKLQDAMKHYQELCMKHEAESEHDKHEKKESPAEEKKEHDDSGKPEHDKAAKEKVESDEGEKEIHVDIDSHKGKGKMEDGMSDEEAKKKALELAEHEEKEMEEKLQKKKNHFETLKNAELNALASERVLELSGDQVARGKARYGSGA